MLFSSYMDGMSLSNEFVRVIVGEKSKRLIYLPSISVVPSFS